MLLVAATEAIDDTIQIKGTEKGKEKEIKKTKKPMLIIESDDDE